MADQAVLALTDVRVNKRKSLVYAFVDRIEIVDAIGSRTVLLTDVARITTKSGLRKGRVTVVVVEGEALEIDGIRARDTPVAYNVLVKLAMDANA